MDTGGRPPIAEVKLEQLKVCFRRQYGPSAAALECGVHRNTASTYFAAFRRGEEFKGHYDVQKHRALKLEQAAAKAAKVDESVWRVIRNRGLAEGITTKELIAKIIKVVVDDGLLDEILGSKSGDGKSLIEAINEVVPRAFQEHERADICQELLLAVLEGEATLDNLKDGSAVCIKRYFKLHPGKFGPVSIDAPIPGTNGLTLADTLPDESTHT